MAFTWVARALILEKNISMCHIWKVGTLSRILQDLSETTHTMPEWNSVHRQEIIRCWKSSYLTHSLLIHIRIFAMKKIILILSRVGTVEMSLGSRYEIIWL